MKNSWKGLYGSGLPGEKLFFLFPVPDLFFCQVTRRVVCPDIAVYRFSPYPEVPVADIEPFAVGAPVCVRFYKRLAVLEACHELVGGISPYLAEFAFLHVAE